MRRKKKTTIVTFEARERLTVRRGSRRVVAWCVQCGTEVLMIAPDEAGAPGDPDEREIFRRIESGEIHFIEGENGALLICSKSLRTRSGEDSPN